MNSLRQQFVKYLLIGLFFICIIHVSQTYAEDRYANGKLASHDQPLKIDHLHNLKEILARRSLYDPAFGDSWSKYLERKRELFDPAYSDWANSFKRSDE